MINLLPPSYKEFLYLSELRRRVLMVCSLLLTFFLTFLLVLLIGFFIVKGEKEASFLLLESYKSTSQSQKFSALKDEILTYNLIINKAQALLTPQISTVEIIDHLTKDLPSDITLSRLNYNQENKTLFLSGVSLNSDALLQFKRNIEADDFFAEVKIPPSVWIKSKDIEFTAEIVISGNK